MPTVIVGMLLVVLFPVLVWSVISGRFDPRKRADTNVCTPAGKTIFVVPSGTDGNSCTSLQLAINTVPNATNDPATQGWEIKLAPGYYRIPIVDLPFAISAQNKKGLRITGSSSAGHEAVVLDFQNNRGGIQLASGSAEISWMKITGTTINGVVRIENTTDATVAYTTIRDAGTNAVQILHSSNVSVYNSNVGSLADAIVALDVNGLSVTNSQFLDSSIGISTANTSGQIKFSLFTGMSEHALFLESPRQITIEGNTVTQNLVKSGKPFVIYTQDATSATDIYFHKNIVAFNNGGGIGFDSTAQASGRYTFDRNDVFSNTPNFGGITNPTGSNGNITSDPKFGTNYCLQTGSPAILGADNFMGHRGSCGDTSTPTPTPSNTPTPTPTGTASNYTMEFRVMLAGVTDGAANGTKVRIRFIGPSVDVTTGQIVLTHTGGGVYSATLSIPFSQLPAGSGYIVTIKGDRHVARKFCRLTGQTSRCVSNQFITIPAPSNAILRFDFTGLSLLPGDIAPQDGKADAFDFDIIKTLLNKSCTSLSSYERSIADLDYSGCITIRDAFLMRKTLETAYDEE